MAISISGSAFNFAAEGILLRCTRSRKVEEKRWRGRVVFFIAFGVHEPLYLAMAKAKEFSTPRWCPRLPLANDILYRLNRAYRQ